MTTDTLTDQFEEVLDADSQREQEPDEPEDELSKEFVSRLVDKTLQFLHALVGHDLHPYQKPLARRIIESIVINDGEEITALASRQSGKSETVADVVATLMVLLPRLAAIYPDLLGKFRNGLMVGMFAPVEAQVETLFSRTVSRLTSEHALEILGDPEIDDVTARTPGITKGIHLKRSGSSLLMMTANPRAKIESKSFHLIIIDECQEADDFVVNKSIMPMGAYYNATKVKTGTPTVTKNNFFKSIQLNKRRQVGKRGRQNHFQWDWKEVAKVNANYGTFIRKEMLRIGEDSPEFQMSYCPTPDTRILTADLRHVPASELRVGDRLVGFDENRPGKGRHRRLQESVVEELGRLTLPCYRITLDDGTQVTTSGDHRWLANVKDTRNEWVRTADLRPGVDRLVKVTDTWGHQEDYRTGYLAAAFEGEGHFSRQTMLGFSQRENCMQAKVYKYLAELGFSTWERPDTGTNQDVTVTHIAGGRAEVMRFLGTVRPERLLDKLDINRLGTVGRHSRDGFRHPLVVKCEYVGPQEVVAIKTSTRTYIAEGLASHNCCKWMLDRGMFVTSSVFDELGDTSQEIVRQWHRTPVLVGIDPARKMDSTVVTVVWVDWDRPDADGFYDHRVLNWLEMEGEDWEDQFYKIVDFLAAYDVLAVGVDTNGVGDVFADRLKRLIPRAEVIGVSSSATEQSARWKHLQMLIQRRMIGWPAHAKTRRLRSWKRFEQQMTDAEVIYKGANYTVKAPDEAHAHDDYVDSLSLACVLTKDLVMPEVEASSNPFFSKR